MQLFASTAPGISSITAAELRALGAGSVEVLPDGVAFSGDQAALARANVELRTASRVLVRMGRFGARTFAELERHAKKLNWRDFTVPGQHAVFRVTAKKCRLYHTGAIAERLAKVADVVTDTDVTISATGAQLFVVRGIRDEWEISADSSGEHLHRRGYRLAGSKAPMRETLAAAAVLASGWDRASPLADLFCGSGTICIEAALLASGSAPGANREFSFSGWPSFVRRVAATPPAPSATTTARAYGFDRDAGAIEAAVANAERAGVAAVTGFVQQPLSAFIPPAESGWIVTNPPYGVRVGERGDLRDLYARFGTVVRDRCGGWNVSFFSADRTLERATGLQLETLLATENGGLPVRLVTTAAK